MKISKQIAGWYRLNKRDLPWRRTKDPYCIWISEIILQQTRVQQGWGYYERFIHRFPDVKSLAKANIDEVLRLWQGLGYYSRARNLHYSALNIYNNGNNFPPTYSELLKLKGVGEYTAAAIASIAYNEPVALADGNVNRVIARIYGIQLPVNLPETKKEILTLATTLLDRKNPGDHNQAMMELGAMVCLPQQPLCKECPVSKECWAYKHNKTAELPVNTEKTKVSNRYINFFVIENESKIVVRKREKKDIWQGLYDFPSAETTKPITNSSLLKTKEIKAICSAGEIGKISKIYKHILSHQKIQARFVQIKLRQLVLMPEWQWVRKKDLHKYALPRLIEIYLKDEGLLN